MSTTVEIPQTAGVEESNSGSEVVIPSRRNSRKIVGGIVVGLIIVICGGWYLYARGVEDTDDAQVDGHLVPVASRVEGTIQTIAVDDNQTVTAGTTLVQLDPRDYQVALDQTQAQYDQAVAQLAASDPNVPMTRITNESDLASDSAGITGAEAAVEAARRDLAGSIAKLKESQAVDERAQANFQRYKVLLDKNEVSRADYDQYKATAMAQVQTVAACQAAVESAEKAVAQRQAQLDQQKTKMQESRNSAPLRLAIRVADIKSQKANAEAAQATFEKAKLNLGYASIVAPVSGVVTQRSAEPGGRVSAGQQLLMIVQTDDLWVTADFKETQLERMHPGQRVKIHVDAMHQDFAGTVESMPAITGSRTSVLPPENATGNYVKVIQRMPVRIRFNPGQKDLDKLRPGMSVEPKVYVE
jgi:membrane fusion protein (multidrug efflux system)